MNEIGGVDSSHISNWGDGGLFRPLLTFNIFYAFTTSLYNILACKSPIGFPPCFKNITKHEKSKSLFVTKCANK